MAASSMPSRGPKGLVRIALILGCPDIGLADLGPACPPVYGYYSSGFENREDSPYYGCTEQPPVVHPAGAWHAQFV